MDSAQRKILPEVAGPARPGTPGQAVGTPSTTLRRSIAVASSSADQRRRLAGRLGRAGRAVDHDLRRRLPRPRRRGHGPGRCGGQVAGRAGTRRPGRRGPDRRAGRGGHRGHHPARAVPAVRPQRDLPHPVPPGPQRPPGRRRGPGRGHPAGPGGPAEVQVAEVTPFGLAGSAGSTPLRITVKGDPPRQLFGKLYARSHLRADRWYKLARERPSRPQPHESSACWRSSTASTNRVSREPFGAARFGQR